MNAKVITLSTWECYGCRNYGVEGCTHECELNAYGSCERYMPCPTCISWLITEDNE